MNKTLVVSLILMGMAAGCASSSKDPNTIHVWHWMTDRDEILQELALEYEQQTGIKVKIELFAPSEAYSQKITVAAQARILPDIYGVLDTKESFSSFIKNGFVADLTQEFHKNNSEWENSLFEKAVATNRFEEGNVYGVQPGIYGVPLDVTNHQMLYNERLLAKVGVRKAPETFKDFLAVVKALKLVGIPGMVSGWGELWMIECFASNYAFNIMGKEKVMATFRGEVPYTDPDWIKVLNVFKELRDQGAFMEGIVTKPNKEAEQDFALGRAAFAFNGSWCVNVYHKMNPDLRYGVMLPPPVSGEHPMLIWGGAGSSFVVNNMSPNKDKAVAFLRWLTAEEQQTFLAVETKTLPSSRQAMQSIPEILSDFVEAMDQTTHPRIWEYHENALVSERWTKGIQAIIIGEKTPEQVAREVQDVKVRELEKEKRRKK